MTKYLWHPDNLRLCERRLRRIEFIAFPLTVGLLSYFVMVAWAYWG